MPELPEVETVKTAIKQKLKGAVIQDVTINNPRLRQTVPTDLPIKIKQASFVDFQRIAKYIVINLSNGISLILHLGMSGTIRLSDTLIEIQKHDHLIFKTSKGFMIYNDPRRFGLCLYTPTDQLKNHPLLKKTGIDPFNQYFSGAFLKEKLIKKTIPIKLALLDQSIVSGIGNIYASEALFLAGILPTRPAQSLSLDDCKALVKGIQTTLRKAIAAGGSSLKDYRKPDGSLGYFQNQHCVYGKEGQACPECVCRLAQTGGIQKIIQGGRSTYFCKTKQR